MYHIFCIHSFVEGHLGSFQLLAIINKAAMKIVEHVSFLPVGTSSGYMTRRGIAGSSGSTMSNFLSLFKNISYLFICVSDEAQVFKLVRRYDYLLSLSLPLSSQ
jgi:hypothetical protein